MSNTPKAARCVHGIRKGGTCIRCEAEAQAQAAKNQKKS